MIKAIETIYAGIKFRSQLEAKWAMYWDQPRVNVKWEYEPEGYFVGSGQHKYRYRPDFYLPELDLWVEIKGTTEFLDVNKLVAAVDSSGDTLPMSGANRQMFEVTDGGSALLILSSLPKVRMAKPNAGDLATKKIFGHFVGVPVHLEVKPFTLLLDSKSDGVCYQRIHNMSWFEHAVYLRNEVVTNEGNWKELWPVHWWPGQSLEAYGGGDENAPKRGSDHFYIKQYSITDPNFNVLGEVTHEERFFDSWECESWMAANAFRYEGGWR